MINVILFQLPALGQQSQRIFYLQLQSAFSYLSNECLQEDDLSSNLNKSICHCTGNEMLSETKEIVQSYMLHINENIILSVMKSLSIVFCVDSIFQRHLIRAVNRRNKRL